MLALLATTFGAGVLGAFARTLAFWLMAFSGLSAAIGFPFSASLSPESLYPRLVWGGLWALLFLLPVPRKVWWLRGLFFSLVPSLVWLVQTHLSHALDTLLADGKVFLTVLAGNAIWGLITAWIREGPG